MMVLMYCENENLRNYLHQSKGYIGYSSKIDKLFYIALGLSYIHNAEKVHKDFHLGNILYNGAHPFISDLGLCQPANSEEKSVKSKGVYGVLPYVAQEVL